MTEMSTRRRAVSIALVAVGTLVSVGVTWWLVTRDSSGIGTQTVAKDACDKTNTQEPFDFRTVVTTPYQEATYNARVSGEDFHLTATMKSGHVVEAIRVDGRGYSRENGGEWGTENLPSISVLHGLIHHIRGGNVVCPQLRPEAKVGDEVLGATSTARFRFSQSSVIGPVGVLDTGSPPVAVASGDVVAKSIYELWVDSTGRLLQTKIVATFKAGDNQPEENRGEMTSIISGVGEPNVITAPVIGQ